MPDSTAGDAFAELLRELKERSGLSYGVLAKRLHLSTSTLHRYCNGDAVPADYAPVERLARLCKAAPEELVELHRRWVLADAMRGRKGEQAEQSAKPEKAAKPAKAEKAEPNASALKPGSGSGSEPEPEAEAEPESEADAESKAEAEPSAVAPEVEVPVGAAEFLAEPSVPGAGSGSGPTPGSARVPTQGRRVSARPRARTVLVAGIAVAAVLGAATVAVNLTSGGSDAGGGTPEAAASTSRHTATDGHRSTAPHPRTSASASASSSASASASPSGPADGDPTADGKGGAPSGGSDFDAAPLTVSTDAYAWESPCTARYLIDRPPTKVAPPPVEGAATAWVASHGAVSSGEQEVTLTVQGTGKETVVLQSMEVQTVARRTPLAWNDYAMGYPGVGCGGGVPTRSFTVALDAVRPAVQPEAGHRNFPFKVSESDPEVFYVKADASAYDVSWTLALTWSSGSRHGVLRIDDHGRPFHTSGNNGRPAFEFPLGGSGWVKAGTTKP
ncbi:helix-turn-helix domain-containing protein [Streptomyces sp. NPDC048045]|uniref:transcriptional regulator n=1 Tax=Streptomyces sp. NPDC048045 TaxID=3154710 RepID=UPI00342A18D5